MEVPERNSSASTHPDAVESVGMKWQALFKDKLRVAHLAMSISGSTIKPHRVLILVDLQGVYFGLQRWLSENDVPMDDGAILSNFAHLQIERTGQEIAARVVAAYPAPTYDLKGLLDSIEIEYVEGKAYLGNEPKVATDATYLDFSVSFEMFYAPVPLDDMRWQLKKATNRGSSTARDQLRKIESGVVTRKGVFERNYKAYDDFVSRLKGSFIHARSQEGFFSFYVGDQGLSNFDEKEVDTRIVVRAMDALHNREADSLCIVSSDQDFVPLHSRAEDFGITSFQVDLSKFTEQDRVGRKIRDLKNRFIRCGIDPSWPLQVLLQGVSDPASGLFAEHNYSRDEWDSLCSLHNKLNDTEIELIEDENGKPAIRFFRPVS